MTAVSRRETELREKDYGDSMAIALIITYLRIGMLSLYPLIA